MCPEEKMVSLLGSKHIMVIHVIILVPWMGKSHLVPVVQMCDYFQNQLSILFHLHSINQEYSFDFILNCVRKISVKKLLEKKATKNPTRATTK